MSNVKYNRIKCDKYGRIIIDGRLKRDADGRIIIASRKLENKEAINTYSDSYLYDEFLDPCLNRHMLDSEEDENVIDWGGGNNLSMIGNSLYKGNISNPLKDKKGKKKKKKDKGKKKSKNKKHKQKYRTEDVDRKPPSQETLRDMEQDILDDRQADFASLDATFMVGKYEFAFSEGQMHCYDKNDGCYNLINEHEIRVLIMKNISGRNQLKLKSGEVDKIYKSLTIYPEIQKTLSGGIGTPYVNCKNGVFDAETGKLQKHNKKYEFTHCINASYDENAIGERFMEFIHESCRGKKKLIMLVQEVIGYALSSCINVKKAFIFYGPPNTGKSLILNIIQRIIGDSNVSHVTIQQLTNEYYLAKMFNAVVNISADLPSEPIKDIGMFKSVVSGLDTVEAREIYRSPVSKACNCKQLYGSNNLIQLKNVGEPESFFNRLLIIPFNNVKAPEEQDGNLSDKLFEERDFIFTWAMGGLMRLVENNFIFTCCKESEAVLERYKATYAPEVSFFNEYLEEAADEMVLTKEVKNKFLKYAREMEIKVHEMDIQKYILSSHPKVIKDRKRYKGSENALRVYIGLRFK